VANVDFDDQALNSLVLARWRTDTAN
jgi:hypothetical protein